MTENLKAAHSVGRQMQSLQENGSFDIYSLKALNALVDLCKGDKIKAFAYYSGVERSARIAESQDVFPENRMLEILVIVHELEGAFSSEMLLEVVYAIHGYLRLDLQTADTFSLQNWNSIREGYALEALSRTKIKRTLAIDKRKWLKRIVIAFLTSASCLSLATLILPYAMRLRPDIGEQAEYKLQLKSTCGKYGVSKLFLSSHEVRVSERVADFAYPAILKTDLGRFFGSVAFPQGTFKNPVHGKTPREEWFVFESNNGNLTLQSETIENNSYAEIIEDRIITECTNTVFFG